MDKPPVSESPPEKHVLIVEDGEDDALMFYHVVSNLLGHKATVARDGRDAVVKLLNNQYDLILLDMNLPYLTGDRVATVIRRIEAHKSTPIVAVTAYDQATVRKRSLGAGCDIYLTKPVDIDTLSDVLTHYLKRPS